MRKFLDSFSWAFLLMFGAPTFFIMLSWYSLPGDLLYPVKLTMEDSFIFVAPTYAAKSGLDIIYTDKRFAEATKLLNEKESPDGLPYFTSQLNTTKGQILRSPNAEYRSELAYAYINRLSEYHAELEAHRLTFANIRESRIKPVISPVQVPQKTAAGKPFVAAASPTPTLQYRELHPTPTLVPLSNQEEHVEEQIGQAQQAVDEVIQELSTVVIQPSATDNQQVQANKENNSESANADYLTTPTPTPDTKTGTSEAQLTPTVIPTFQMTVYDTPTPTRKHRR